MAGVKSLPFSFIMDMEVSVVDDFYAWITMTPICEKCGCRLEYAVVREDILEHESGFLYKEYIVRPSNCPGCGRKFIGVKIKEVVDNGV